MHAWPSIWLLPIALTALAWAAAFFWPHADADGVQFPYGVIFSIIMRAVVAVAITLLVWLAFFIWLFVAGA